MLEERLSRMSEASRRISENLDFDQVLQDVVESARLLTDARYGVIIAFDESGQVKEFRSSGLTSEESQRLWETPGGLPLFGYLQEISEPLRLRDFHRDAQTQRFPAFSLPTAVNSFLAAPIRHREENLGSIFLANKEPKLEFTRADEETLVMFASQAALVIASTRRYQDELRARTRLETLVDTSPIGVVVFDAKSGRPLLINREAARIGDSLRNPGEPPEELLDVITFRRADGSEISLQETSLAQALSTGETLRAEEITIRVPDGRTMTTLVNATPIRSEVEGGLDVFVVTAQDMAPLEETERLRAEFLAMVSHELRMPLATIKGSTVAVLDARSTYESTELAGYFRIIDQQADQMSRLISDLLDVARIQTGSLSVTLETVAIADLVDQAKNTFLRGGGKTRFNMELQSDLPPVLADPARIAQVLANLFSNAVRLAPEMSTIRVKAVMHEDDHVAVSVADDGIGISTDRLHRLFRKFSSVADDDRGAGAAGSGLGLAICKGIVETHGGRIWAESDGPGKGACFTFTLPVFEETGGAAPLQPAFAPTAPPPAGRDRIRILVVDDNPDDLRRVRNALSESGYEPVVATDPQEALRLFKQKRPQLALLDLMLFGSSGIDLMKEIHRLAKLPIVFLSVYTEGDAVARALDMGATDYICKPFSKTELIARIRAALRKHNVSEPSGSYRRGDLTINYTQRIVTRAGVEEPLHLTALEYRLLELLSTNAGTIVTYEDILWHVWHLPSNGDMRPLRTAVRSLRRKLQDSATDPSYIFTEPRIGYSMAKGDEPL